MNSPSHSDLLAQLLAHKSLTPSQMQHFIQSVMTGVVSDAMMAAILIALRQKGESIDEITAAAQTMHSFANLITLENKTAVDIVGTGGDGANLFNVSTAAALTAAAAGVTVAKHGNRGVSTASGASDVLSLAGVALDLTPAQVKACIEQCQIGFLFAPNHHPAMRHAAAVRRELKVRTLFNLLGPLTNPACVSRLVVGVFDPALCTPLAYVLQNLGAVHALVVHALDGLDEYSISGKTLVAELKNGEVTTYHTHPSDVGISCTSLDGLCVKDAAQSLELIQKALTAPNTSDSQTIKNARALIAINAGAAIYVSGQTTSHQEGVQLARHTIASGRVLDKLAELVAISKHLKDNL